MKQRALYVPHRMVRMWFDFLILSQLNGKNTYRITGHELDFVHLDK